MPSKDPRGSQGSTLVSAPRRKSAKPGANSGARRKSQSQKDGVLKRVSGAQDSEASSAGAKEGESFTESQTNEEITEEIESPETEEERNHKREARIVCDETEVPDETGDFDAAAPSADAAAQQQQQRQSLSGARKEQVERLRAEVAEQFFDDMDANGDGQMDMEELQVALVELGITGASEDDVHRFFLTGDTISLDTFVAGGVYQKLRDLRKDYAEADLHEYEEIKRDTAETGTTAVFLPERVLRILLEFADVVSLKDLSGTCQKIRRWATDDIYWKAALLKRRRLEQMKSGVTSRMLPELKCGNNYYKWYLEWVKQCCDEDGVKQWDRRQANELVGGGEPSVFTAAKVSTCLYVLPPVAPAEPAEPAEGEAPPPPPPPELPLVFTGDEKGDVAIRAVGQPDPATDVLSEHDATITSVCSNDAYIFLASEDCTTTVWRRTDLARPAFTLIGHGEAVSIVVFLTC